MLIENGPFKGLIRNGYRVISADPPWSFKAFSKETGLGRSADRHYHCMDLESIMALPVHELAAKDCVLLIWVTDPILQQAMRVVEAWGFKYSTVGYYWAKTNQDEVTPSTGMGFWTRANPEQAWAAGIDLDDCMSQVHLFTKGHPKRLSAKVRRLIVSPRREHSRKPDEFFEYTEALVGGPYLELFAREERPGWTTWGNEVGKFRRAEWDDLLDPAARFLVDGDPYGGLV
jgi:N6-adenosine-specific RNA methylase IME4